MNRLAIALVLASACSSGQKAATPNPQIYAKRVAVSWGIQPAQGSADVFLQMTDETGKQTSYPLGSFKGTCKVFVPPQEMAAISGVTCAETEGGPATEIHAVVRGEEIVVMRLKTAAGEKADPMAREEVTRVKAPAGASIEPG